MARTMRSLLALRRAARTARHTAPLPDGLPADEELLLDAPEPWLAPALVAAGAGDHEAAAKLLATTRERARWEVRDRAVRRLAAFAARRPEWYAHWTATAPHDPGLLLLRAQVAVHAAWESPVRAELLRETAPLVAAAAGAQPEDPVPWRLALDVARGTGAGHAVFTDLWERAARRSPHHDGSHVSALLYLSAAWHGSHGECFDFAERAAEDALPGSLSQALPLRAAYLWLRAEWAGDAVPGERVVAAAERARALSARFAEGDPWPAEVRNLLVYVLVRLRAWDAALQEVRRVGPLVTSLPWARLSDDPLARFMDVRDGVRVEAAAAAHPRGTDA
ncbi:hypothetical protein [Streptomyces sp. NRRL F-5630]|uniref:hypothetical protein n=1 Tax=Streptomyces sp. NRRL F-5630 TaxID=1463864 RepID=UPI003D71639C